ncbi:hypothetical protein KP509_31G065300 [Ceratopteris richardii]|uniref:Autophagy-related protein 11 n=1 Tax=Ceratopteris richardii TaxID=49495 RepID=A0A8T2QZJ3_CERRI|nr:hypothetical protein KP509_31G065300 [Ceratopteris richardii]KAH7289237.1 hypothetical protein KP509_31G065300 [Ceratopteris richardii]
MEDSTETAKLIIYVAESGQSFELKCPHGTLVQHVQACLASLTRVPVSDQLLICEDIRLEPQRSLESYRLPAQGRHIFLYNRARLLADVPPPPPEQVDVKDLVLPSPPLPLQDGYPFESLSDPAIKALPSYERQFRFHFDKGLAIFNATHVRFDICRRLLHEKQVQNMAIDAAKRNMNHHYKMIDQMYLEFMKHFNRQQKQHADILSNLDRDIDRLRKWKLHPSLIGNGRETLLDCLDTAHLSKEAQSCASSHKQFQGKVMQLKAIFAHLQKNVEDFSHFVPSVDVYESERALTDHASVVDEEKTIMQSLSKDTETVKKLVNDCRASNFSLSMKPHDAVSALGPMHQVHVNSHLPKMEFCYQKIVNLLQSFCSKKHQMCCCVHTCMQKVAALQSSIRDVRNQLAAFKEALSRQEEVFKQVKLVRQIGPAYRTCLAEVVRRKANMKLYMGHAGQLAEKMARSREGEITVREEFLRNCGGILPREVLVSLGLFGSPSQCIINIEPYDTELLDIDILDVEKYAPESLFGTYLSKGLADSCSLPEKSDPESTVTRELDLINDSQIEEEISGTSKLEVENAWLKAELASKIALSFSAGVDLEGLSANERDSKQARNLASQKTAEALAMKDEYARHLQNSLKASQQQCNAYEKRIRELEQRLADQHDQLQKLASNESDYSLKTDKPEVSGVTEDGRPLSRVAVVEPMDDGANSSQPSGRGYDEVVAESVVGATMPHDTAMAERVDIHASCRKESVRHLEQKDAVHAEVDSKVQSALDETNECTGPDSSTNDNELLRLQDLLTQKNKYCIALEEKLQLALSDADCAHKELQEKAGLLRECQFNCAELETSLHLAREESRIKQCSVDRKVAEYNTLRTSSVKLRSLLERLHHCISSPSGGCMELSESLRVLVASLPSDADGDGTADFCACIKGLAERIGKLAQQQSDLLEHCNLVETSKGQLATELEKKVELLKNQYVKRKMDKQANKEKICYTRFQVHELAMFSINGRGHYEAVNRGCPNYYLSDESVALFLQSLPERPAYIIGQIVHIERNIAHSPFHPGQMTSLTEVSSETCANNPYGLPNGTVYYVVTLAMVPDRLPSLPSVNPLDVT